MNIFDAGKTRMIGLPYASVALSGTVIELFDVE